MSMVKGMFDIGSSKKGLSRNDAILEQERLRHNKEMRRKHLHENQYHDLPSYKKYLLGKKAVKSTNETYSWGQTTYRRASKADTVKSLDTGATATTKIERKEYTGDLVKGIGTLHKSNAVPVIDEDYAKEIARMRRG